jgi:hypothetical protein
MLGHAKHGVGLALPSFEQDETGEGRLRKHGLRFNWTSWRGHPSHFKVCHAQEALDIFNGLYTIAIKPGREVKTSDHPNIVPDLDQEDLGNYDPEIHGPKPAVVFDPPIVGEWDVQIKWN